MKKPRCLLLALILISVGRGPIAAGAEGEVTSAELQKALGERKCTLRQAQNVSAKQYYRIGDKEFLCRHKMTGLYPNRLPLGDITVMKIRQQEESEILNRVQLYDGKRIETKDVIKNFRYWVFTLKHPYLGRGEFRITTASGDLP